MSDRHEIRRASRRYRREYGWRWLVVAISSWRPHPEDPPVVGPVAGMTYRARTLKDARRAKRLMDRVVHVDDGWAECWCGVEGPADKLFEPVDGTCDGSGSIACYCGGDLCVCHNHGGVYCEGCVDCTDEEPGGDEPDGDFVDCDDRDFFGVPEPETPE